MPLRLIMVGVAAAILMASSGGCQRRSAELPAEVERGGAAIQPSKAEQGHPKGAAAPDPTFVGSKSCRDCHEDFYKLWATSFHGLAMQPYTPAFGRKTSRAPGRRNRHRQDSLPGGDRRPWRTDPPARSGRREDVPYRARDGREERLLLSHAPGARAIAGPAAGLRRPQECLVRHGGQRRAPLCRPPRRSAALGPIGCSPSTPRASIATSANSARTTISASDTYKTTWSEPGISCESCHGPASEHLRAMEIAADPKKVHDIKIIRAKEFTPEQMNDMCATCHAKLVPLSLDFLPGDKFFDHFDLVVLDHPDYLSGRPRPGRELHLHVLDDEPLREVGQARLQPLPYPERPLAICGHGSQQVLRALPSEATLMIPLRTGITHPAARGTTASDATCP